MKKLAFLFALLLPTVSAFAASEEGLRVQIDALHGFSQIDEEKVERAATVLEGALNSEEFQNEVLNFTWNGERSFADNGGLTNEKIYSAIIAGRETYSDQEDHIANLNLTLYSPPFFKRWSVVGYGYPGKPQVYVNRNYFKSMSLASLAGLLAHEWCHKLGFNHDYQRTAKRPYSVPYGVGGIVTQIANALFKLEGTSS
jgi:hypothetical protein